MSSNNTVATVAVIGKKGRVLVNVSDLAEWQAKGYKLVSDAKPEVEAEKTEYGLEDYTVPELKVLAEEAGIKTYPTMSKVKLIEALRQAPTKPEVEAEKTE